jgi:hypothetical protein
MKSKMRTGEFINEDPTNYLIESVLQFNDLKRKLRKKAAEKDKKGKAIGFRKVLQDHVKILHRQHNLDPDIGTHAKTVLFLDFLSVADSQQKIEAGLRSFITDVEAHPIGQQGFFEQPPMAEILDRTIGAHRTEAKVDAQTAETPTRPPTDLYQAREAFDETKVREDIDSEQIHARDEEVDYSVREDEPVVLEESPYGEQGPSDAEMAAIEAQADAELSGRKDWDPDKELKEINELERMGEAMDEDSRMMNCILGKL